MLTIKILVLSAVIGLCAASPACSTFNDCSTCASHQTWVPNSNCRWCPKDNGCHSEWSVYDTCSSSQIITDPKKCPASPTPPPTPPSPAPKSDTAEKVVAELFKLLQITDVDPATCVNDVGGVDAYLRDFSQDIAGKNYSLAIDDFSRALSALSTSVSTCGVSEVQTKIDMLAAAIKWANISTSSLDKSVKIIVDASDLWNDLVAVATAAAAKDPTAIGTSIGALLTDWTSITGGCSNSTSCKFLDGLLRMVQVVAENVGPCEAAIDPAVTNLTSAMQLFEQKQYTQAVAATAAGLDGLAVALSTDACGLSKVSAVLVQVVPKLASAVVTVENSTAVKIIVGSADIYDELYKATMDVKNGDSVDFGVQMGLLLAKLRASSCQTEACTVLEGLLAALQIEATDLGACSADIDIAWTNLTGAISSFESKKFSQGLSLLGGSLASMANSVTACGASDLAKVLEDVATKLGDPSVATEIGVVLQVLVQSADVTLDIQKLVQDASAKSWSAVGHDLGSLASWLQGTGCTSFVCKLVEGILNAASIPLQDLQACEADLKGAETDFVAGASAVGNKDFAGAVKYWSSGLNSVSKSVADCGLASELSFMEQEANVLGFGNVTILGEAATILVHGSDFYENLYGAFQAFETHDYRTAGTDLGNVMTQLSQWTTGHSCTSPICYVVTGIMQYLGDIQGDIKSCEADIKLSWGNFTGAFNELRAPSFAVSQKRVLTSTQALGDFATSGDFGFNTDPAHIKAGIKDIGYGFQDLATGVSDCHLQELSEILADLAAKLGLTPEVQFLEDVLKILIDGVQIEQEIGNACLDWSNGNWVGFGYNIIALIKNLL